MTSPSRIMFIRHAEKPTGSEKGVDSHGAENKECLSVRGWERAGALGRFFVPVDGSAGMKPNTIYAAGIGDHSPSHRPKETVKPLVDLLGNEATFNDSFWKNSGKAMIADVMTKSGIVLICWEHQLIPTLASYLPNPPTVPQTWPDDRFDVVWICDADGDSWAFSQVEQMLLAGDQDTPIS